MIDLKELRLGNIVWDIASGSYAEVMRIDATGELTTAERETNEMAANALDPVPLTPEWMDKAGFVRKHSVLQDGNMDTIWEYDTVEFSTDYELMVSDPVTGASYRVGQPLKSLHQLQNLYYFLMGTELEITL